MHVSLRTTTDPPKDSAGQWPGCGGPVRDDATTDTQSSPFEMTESVTDRSEPPPKSTPSVFGEVCGADWLESGKLHVVPGEPALDLARHKGAGRIARGRAVLLRGGMRERSRRHRCNSVI